MVVSALLESAATEDREPDDPELHFIRIPHSVAQPEGFARWHRGLSYHRICVSQRANALWLYPPIGDRPIRIPMDAFTPEGYCRWAASRLFPPNGRVSFFPNEMVLDMSPEELISHNHLKTAIVSSLHFLVVENDLGRLFGDRALLTNQDTVLRTEPDGVFVSWERLADGTVELKRRRRRGEEYTEILGSPDWVLEVVSRSSIREDYRTLRDLYHRAGVREYWLVDATGREPLFRIWKHRKKGYVASRPRDGWVQSQVFGEAFRLRRQRDRLGMWLYRLETRPH